MNTKDLLKEAIADAKTVRETALAQAKLALEEAFTPRLQSMFTAKLQERMDDMEEGDDMEMEAKHKRMGDDSMDNMAEKKTNDMESYDDDDNRLEEIDLEEILAELDEMDKDDLNEADEKEIEAKEDVEDMEDDAKEDESEEKEVSELSMDELEELIRDIVSQEMGPDGGDEDIDADIDVDAELPDTADDEVNLDEILAELLDEKEELYEGKKRSKYGGNKGDIPASKRGKIKKDTAEEEGVEDYKKKKKELSEIVTGVEFEALKTFGENAYFLGPLVSILGAAGVATTAEIIDALKKNASKVKDALSKKDSDAKKMEESISILHQELQEVNLLNAKLLYVNKIFKAKNLNEAQKLKVVKAFDKAESAKEAKLVYESLNETFSSKTDKNQIRESLGFASKAVGIAPQKQQIVEGNDFIARMQKLANIK